MLLSIGGLSTDAESIYQITLIAGCPCICTCRYLENVPAIVPLLEKEYRNAARRLEDTQDELNDLHPDK